ncbi:ABC transporter substrate-binding protein [Cohnella sp. GCM10020058]|uniref:ABC transporter substrate-binding protein n=1 Tax=Cohnella sp. GCM10020058 TaxID=3317330 RepID=UPI003641379E
MKTSKKLWIAPIIAGLLGVALLGCSANGNNNAAPASTASASVAATQGASSAAAATASASVTTATERSYTDYKGHTVLIPTEPRRVVFAGETTGDLIELDLPLVGIFGEDLEGRVYKEKAEKIEDVGFPINLEKVTSLTPDLIMVADTDEEAYEQLSKIAPTIMFDTFATLEVRMKELGEIFGIQETTNAWLADYETKAAAMWDKLYATVLKPGETASVLTYYPGDRLFAMARAGLPQLLYSKGGLKPTAPIQEILDAGEGFRQFSAEAIGQYAGDLIFILDPVADEAKKSTETLLNSPVWKALPAVKNGRVYRLYIQSSDSDAATRKWMLEELPRMLQK